MKYRSKIIFNILKKCYTLLEKGLSGTEIVGDNFLTILLPNYGDKKFATKNSLN